MNMDNKQIIRYIKVRENWRETLRAKSGALSSVWNGLFRLGSFLAYYAVEKWFLAEEINKLYEQHPNYKYIFYLGLAFGLRGLVGSLIAAIKYFNYKEESEKLRQEVEELERRL